VLSPQVRERTSNNRHGSTPLHTEPDQQFFRIIIGCYSHQAEHWLARDEMRSNGLQDHQICSVGCRNALTFDNKDQTSVVMTTVRQEGMIHYHSRKVRELKVHVSSTALFDDLCPQPHDHDGSIAHWMTCAQSNIILEKLYADCPLLIVSAISPQQQIRSSQIQLRHGPVAMLAFNFAR
jgi:hypothetical protein